MGIEWAEFRVQEIDSEIEEAFFYLEPTYEWDGSHAGDPRVKSLSTQESTVRAIPTKQEIAAMFNATFAIGEEVDVTVKYGGSNRRYVSGHSLEWEITPTGIISSSSFNRDYIRNKIEADPWYYLANSKHKTTNKDSDQFQLYNPNPLDMPYGDSTVPSNRLLGTTQVKCIAENRTPVDLNEIIACFAFMDPFSFEKIGEVYNEYESTTNTAREDGEILNYTYTQKFKFTGMSDDNAFLDDVLDWYEQQELNNFDRKTVLQDIDNYKRNYTFHTKDTLYKRALDQMRVYVDIKTGVRTRGVTNSLYFDGFLRVDVAKAMRRKDFAVMIGTTITTGQEAEEASFFEKFVTGIIIVLSIVVGVLFPPSFMLAGSIVWSAVAVGAGYASLVLAVGMFALSYFGGLSAQGMVKVIGAFAQVVGYIAAFAGVMAIIKSAGSILAQKTLGLTAAEAATQAGQEMITQEMLKQTMTDQIGALLEQSLDSITTKLTEFVTMPIMDKVSFIQDGLGTITEALKMYQDKELEELQEEMAIIDKQIEEDEVETLSNQLKHPGAVYAMMEDQITSYDALNNMSDKIASTIGRDKNFSMWYSNVNSV